MKYKTEKKKPLLPKYAVFPLLSCVIVNFIVYSGAESLTGAWKHYDLTLAFDRAVPLVPGFVIIYLGCYIFWITNYILIARQSEEHCIRFATADMMSRIICGIIFIVLPTTNVRPELAGNGISVVLLQMVYGMDAPTRLFPSFHCLVSWLCYIGIRGQKGVSKGYRVFSCVFALLVCASTQFTKQHYIVDVVGGIAVAEAAYWIAFSTGIYRYPEKLFCWLCRKVFCRRGESVRKEGEI